MNTRVNARFLLVFRNVVTVSYFTVPGATTSTGLGDQPADNMP